MNSAIFPTAPSSPATPWPAFGLGSSVAICDGLAHLAYALLLPAMRDDLQWLDAQTDGLGDLYGLASGKWPGTAILALAGLLTPAGISSQKVQR